MNANRTPVLFIHGLWLHASSWQPWVDLFAEEGYAPAGAGLARRPRDGRGRPRQPGRASPTTASTRSPPTTPASSGSCRPGRSSSGTRSAG